MTRNRKLMLWLLLFVICITAAGFFYCYIDKEPVYGGTFAASEGGTCIGHLY